MVQKAPSNRRRTVIIEEPDISEYLLQDIIDLPQPERQNRLEEWLEAGNMDVEHGGTVKIGTPDGKPMQFNYQGKQFNVPPAGRRVTREVALRLIQLYGERGRYYGRDQATGVEYGQEFSFTEEQEKWAKRQNFKYNTNYIVQISDNLPPVSRGKKVQIVEDDPVREDLADNDNE